MNDDELAEIRRRKRDELESRLRDGEADSASVSGAEDTPAVEETPTEPVRVAGRDELTALVVEHDVVLVDFYADWCGPCKMLEPTVEALARESDAAVAKVDVDANQPLAAEYGVRGVPTLVVFAGGEAVERVSGVRTKAELAGLLERHGA
ncbi:thioredoxin [Halobium salinum]|uniref:Thioredoxin n=1 Tax=Halobium salinum TaxID=1364940 RepID=A0ABD5PGH7_9EURY|nr:thioredoxin [Halobium salinum]